MDAYEVGAKSTLWSGRMQVNLAAFYYDYQDKQLLTALNDPFFGPLPVLDNAPESEVTGAEADIVLSPIENLALTAALSYLDTEIIQFESINRDGNDQDFAGDPFNFAPRWSYRLGINYDLPLGNAMILALAADYAFTDETNSVLGNDPRFHHDAYHVANVRASLSESEGRWQATLWGRNITDEYYVQGVFNPGDTIGRYTGMPRSYGVSLQYHYF